jgi:hypothetical protein
MFFHNPGTKELVDALIMCRRVFHHMDNKTLPKKASYFEDTRMMGDYLDDLVRAVEGRASGEVSVDEVSGVSGERSDPERSERDAAVPQPEHSTNPVEGRCPNHECCGQCH